jgi:hypothetical protein
MLLCEVTFTETTKERRLLLLLMLIVTTEISSENIDFTPSHYFPITGATTPAAALTNETRTTTNTTNTTMTTMTTMTTLPNTNNVKDSLDHHPTPTPTLSLLRWLPQTFRSPTNAQSTTSSDSVPFQQFRAGGNNSDDTNYTNDTTVSITKTTTLTSAATAAATVVAALMMNLPKHVQLLYQQLCHSILHLNHYIGGSTERCWMVLFLSIILDTTSTITMKQAQHDQSLTKLLLAYLGYFIRYVKDSCSK